MNLIENFQLWMFPWSQKCINFSGYVVNAPLLTATVEHGDPAADGRAQEHPALAAPRPPQEPPACQSPPQHSQRSTGAQRQVGTVSCPGSSQDSPSGPTAPWPRYDAHSGESNGAALCPFWTEAAQSTSPGLEMLDTLWDPGEEHSGTLEHLLQDGRTQKFQRQENRWIKVIFQHRGQKGTVTGFFSCVDMPFEYSQSHILTKSHL